jgi:hypothetical protein
MNLWHAAVRKSMEERRPIVSKLVRWKPTDIRRLATDRVPMDFPDSSNPVHHALRRTAALSNFIFNLIPHCDGITYGPELAANNLIGQLSRSPAANLNKNQKKCECCCSTCWNLWKFWGYAIRTSDSICSIDARLRVWDDNDFIPSFSSIYMCTKKKKKNWRASSCWADRSIELSYQKKKCLSQNCFSFPTADDFFIFDYKSCCAGLFPRTFLSALCIVYMHMHFFRDHV